MLVYHDWSFKRTLRAFARECLYEIKGYSTLNIDRSRQALIRAGQLEQGYFDSLSPNKDSKTDELATAVKTLTDEAARAFCADFRTEGSSSRLQNCLSAKTSLERLQDAEDCPLTIKVPEGFEYYSLFPEQYCVSAERWAADHRAGCIKRVLVVGIRSIGTTLSAVVAATLSALGWEVERITVRPTGPPFDREMAVRPLARNRSEQALIVDEGPGLSGSSVIAVARWLRAGEISEIALLPGHQAGPGPEASMEILSWWSKLPVYFTPLEAVRWQGRSLEQMLRSKCEHSGELRDVSGGQWRHLAYQTKDEWPAVCANLERRKLLSIGRGRSVLWKFDGFGCDCAGLQTNRRNSCAIATDPLVPAVLPDALGFLGMHWIDGQRLRRAEGKRPEIIAHVAQYVCRRARAGLVNGEGLESIERLARMLRRNAEEAFGNGLEAQVEDLRRAAENFGTDWTYGDGRLAPHEWIRTGSGKILKTDHKGHSCDHTIVGEQSFLWDVAGAIEEWDWKGQRLESFLDTLAATHLKVDARALDFYRCAYAAFRMGIFSLGARQEAQDKQERERLSRAEERFRQKLRRLIKKPSD